MKRTPLKRKPQRRTLSEKARAAAWWDAVMRSTGGRCAIHPDVWAADAHHVIEKRQLRRRDIDPYEDARNGLALCRRCHERNHTATERVPRAAVPAAAEEYAAELGLSFLLDRLYGEA